MFKYYCDTNVGVSYESCDYIVGMFDDVKSVYKSIARHAYKDLRTNHMCGYCNDVIIPYGRYPKENPEKYSTIALEIRHYNNGNSRAYLLSVDILMAGILEGFVKERGEILNMDWIEQ